MGRNPSKKQMGVGLPAELRERLEVASAGASHSLAEEIRRRVERTFKEDAGDPVTRELIAGILNLAETIRLDLGAAWHTYPAIHEAFAAAIAQRLAGYMPASSPGAEAAIRDLLGAGLSQPQDSPETIGRTHERHDQRSHSYEQLQAIQRRKLAALTKHIRKPGGKS
jgi:hypothetical protein